MKKSGLILTVALFCVALTQRPYAEVAQTTPKHLFIRCLGQEEGRIHKMRMAGPLFKLNQKLVNEFSGFTNAQLKAVYYQQICGPQIRYPSLAFIQFHLLYGNDIFVSPQNLGLSLQEETYYNDWLADLKQRVPEYFTSYINLLRLKTPYSRCLDEQIPQFEEFMTIFQNALGETSIENILKPKSRINTIFSHLQNFDQIYRVCEEKVKKKDAEDAT